MADQNGNTTNTGSSGNMPDPFDRTLGQFEGGLPGLTKTKISTLRIVPPLGVGGSIQITTQTFRQEGQLEDDMIEGDGRRAPAQFFTFVQVVHGDKVQRFLMTDPVLNTIRRQMDSLTSQAVKRAAQRGAATRRARGFVPDIKAARAARARGRKK